MDNQRGVGMKAFAAIFILLVSVNFNSALADAQVNQIDNYCHFPYDNGNVDRELYLSGCQTSFNNQLNTVWMQATVKNVHDSLLPGLRPSADLSHGTETTKTSGQESGTVCTITAADGTQYSASDWQVSISVDRTRISYLYDVRYQILCRNGAEVQ